jgi:HPt (histidine-containing phosphotransfer) domain-containing protein
MARRDISGVVDFGYLETYAGQDMALVEEVLGLFREQAKLWGPMLREGEAGWRDAAHTLKGAARGIGANRLGQACEEAEEKGASALPTVHAELDAALADVAAYLHELALQSLRAPRSSSHLRSS